MILPCESLIVALSCSVAPAWIELLGGVTTTAETAPG
jgi:hypothetical protein